VGRQQRNTAASVDKVATEMKRTDAASQATIGLLMSTVDRALQMPLAPPQKLIE
jgi:hypothetical protein